MPASCKAGCPYESGFPVESYKTDYGVRRVYKNHLQNKYYTITQIDKPIIGEFFHMNVKKYE